MRTQGGNLQRILQQAIIAFLDSTDFEDAIRKAVSLGGDIDTLACITGGIAEAFYGRIPGWIEERVWQPFPKEFTEILEEMKEKTPYGRLYGKDEEVDPKVG